jgi:hypothetical protein
LDGIVVTDVFLLAFFDSAIKIGTFKDRHKLKIRNSIHNQTTTIHGQDHGDDGEYLEASHSACFGKSLVNGDVDGLGKIKALICFG